MTGGCGRKIGPYDCCTIVTGDARLLATEIPDESVDLIFTDPPYAAEFIPLYGWLAEIGARLLSTDGSCLVLCGHEHLGSVMQVMDTLTYHWICCLWQPGKSSLLWHKQIMTKWKPILWFTKEGQARPKRWFMDGVEGIQDKRFHQWGQALAWARLIDRLETSCILDPFCGGGTVPAVCKMLGRHYLAFEIEPDVAERARERVRNTQPPLFVISPEQTEMAFDDILE